MVCEYCSKEHDGKYGSGRFCNNKCARGFATKLKREEISKKVSITLLGRKYPNRKKKSEEGYRRQGLSRQKYNEILRSNQTFEELSERFKKEKLLEEQNNKCACCEMVFVWMEEKLVPHLHHKDANRKNKNRENCELLCPNCHSITKNWGFRNRHHKKESKKKIGLNSKVREVWDRKKGKI